MPPLLPSLLAALALAYVALCGLVMLAEPSLVFYPVPFPEGDWGFPERHPGQVEDVQLTNADGHAVHGWFFPSEGAKHTLLFLHGNAGNLTGRADWALRLARELPAQVLLIDYGGYGKSQGPVGEANVYADAEAAYAHLVEARGADPAKLVFYGRSLGGGPATELATRKAKGGLILESCFTSIPDMGARMYPFLPVRLLARNRFDNLAKVPALALPKLIVHSRRDEVIPFAMGERLYRDAAEPKAWLELTAPGHNETAALAGDRLIERYRAFLTEL